MRIGVFTNTYLPTINGVVNAIHAFRRGLERLGHEVIVFAPGTRDCPAEHRVVRYRAVRPRPEVDYPVALPSVRAVGEAFRSVDLDLIHTHHPWWVGVWGLRHARRSGLPVVTTIHTQYELYSHYVPFYQPLAKRVLRKKTLRYCQKVDLVLTPGPARKRQLEELGVKTPIEVVPNATDIEPFQQASGESVRQRYGLAPDQPLAFFAGRIAREKNLDVVLNAMVGVVRELPQARLLLAGDGPELAPLQQLAAERGLADTVIFAGRVPYDEMPEYHAAADVFATASLSEVQPISLTETMAARTPVVAVRADWAEDVVVEGENGLLTENNAGALARGLVRALADTDLRGDLSQGASRHAEQYAIIPASQRLLEVYETLLQRHNESLGHGDPGEHGSP